MKRKKEIKEKPSVKLLKKHKKDCIAVQCVKDAFWNTAWAFPERIEWKSSRCDNRGRTTMWHILKCNSSDCPAEVAINNDAICALVDKELRWNKQAKFLKDLDKIYI